MTGLPVPPGPGPQPRRHRLRGAITMLLLVGLLATASWYGWNAMVGTPNDTTTVTTATEKCPLGRPLLTSDVTVNIYNASSRQGVARTTAQALSGRGFLIGAVTNAPKELAGISGSALVVAQASAPDAAALVAAMAKNKPTVRLVERESDRVDLVIGPTWRGLRSVRLPKATDPC